MSWHSFILGLIPTMHLFPHCQPGLLWSCVVKFPGLGYLPLESRTLALASPRSLKGALQFENSRD